MTDNEIITDEQLIMALEEHIRLRNLGICEPDTPLPMLIPLLDLLNRQKAEIERLKPFEKKLLKPVVENLKEEMVGDTNE